MVLTFIEIGGKTSGRFVGKINMGRGVFLLFFVTEKDTIIVCSRDIFLTYCKPDGKRWTIQYKMCLDSLAIRTKIQIGKIRQLLVGLGKQTWSDLW